ncbi:MAG: HEAT repeat domain-containing protein [Planctomycetes bacterium]|nr:HEAT repeat domain-containing protein [Planctomycetota bacterium]
MSSGDRTTYLMGWRAASLLGLTVLACHPAESQRRRLASANAFDRAQAAVTLAEASDPEAVQKLVNLLEDQDRAVRMYAILALRRLCGEDYEYKYYAPEPERLRAVQRWRDALQAGEVVVQPRTARLPSGEAGSTDPEADARSPASGGAGQTDGRMQ